MNQVKKENIIHWTFDLKNHTCEKLRLRLNHGIDYFLEKRILNVTWSSESNPDA